MKKKIFLVLPALWVFGCSGEDDGTETPVVSYYQHIAPLYADRCVGCHQQGGVAPFALDNLKDAQTFGAASKGATGAGQMPPYLVTSDGSCGDFDDPRALTAEQVQLIADWVDGGMEPGEVETIPSPRALATLDDTAISLQTPEFLPEIVGDALAQFDEYRCFLVDPQLEEDTFLTGYEVLPGNNAIVHHVLAFPVDLEGPADTDEALTNGEVIQALDAESPERDGWPCFGMAGDGVGVDGIPVTWAPGMGAVRFPHGSGVELPQGRQVVIQVHYNLANPKLRGQSDQTIVKLETRTDIERLGFFDLPDLLLNTLFEGDPVMIPPGEKNWEYEFEIDYDEVLAQVPQLEISGVFPHMHERGRSLRFEIIRGKEKMCRAQVESWDFNWQLFYFYEKPIELELGDKLRVTCGYNTEGLTEPVLPGWGTMNEMCLAGLMLTVPL